MINLACLVSTLDSKFGPCKGEAIGGYSAQVKDDAEKNEHVEEQDKTEGVKQAKNEGEQVDKTLDQGEEDVETNVDHLDHKDAHDEQQAEVKQDNQKQKQIQQAITALVVAIDKKARLDCELVRQTKVCRATFKACTPEELREMHKMLLSMKTAFANTMTACQQLEADLKTLCAQCS